MYKLKKFAFNKTKLLLIKNYCTDPIVEKCKLTISDIPNSKSVSKLGTTLDLILSGGGNKLHDYVDKRHKVLGDIFVEKMDGADIVFTSNPQLMKSLFMKLEGKYPDHILPEPWILYEKLNGSKRGLFFMKGHEWLENRRIMNKYLLQNNPDIWLESPIKTTINEFVVNLKYDTRKNPVPEMENILYMLSIHVIINILIGSKHTITRSMFSDDLVNLFAKSVKDIFATTTKLHGLNLKWSYRLNLKRWTKFEDSVNMSLLLAKKLVEEMLQNKEKLGDGLMKKLSNENLKEETLIRIVADFVIAAGDTTSYSTLWILFLLAKNKQYVPEIRKEDHMFTKNVIREAMRLYPVAPFLTRILTKDCVFGKYKLVSGTPIVASIYTSGRDERYFTKADQFLPYRWNRKDPRSYELINHEPSASLPFAMGTRSCIGKKIAMMQLTELIKQITDMFEFECVGDTADLKASTLQVLVPDRPVRLHFTDRN